MKPTNDELIEVLAELKRHIVPEAQMGKRTYSNILLRLQGRLDVLEEWVNLAQYEYQSKWIKEEIAKIKEVLK